MALRKVSRAIKTKTQDATKSSLGSFLSWLKKISRSSPICFRICFIQFGSLHLYIFNPFFHSWLGKITMESYISQFHIWLRYVPDRTFLLTLFYKEIFLLKIKQLHHDDTTILSYSWLLITTIHSLRSFTAAEVY